MVEHVAELAAVGLGSAFHIAKSYLAAGMREPAHLIVEALTVGRTSDVAVFHAPILQQNHATGKWLAFSGPRIVTWG